MKMNDIEKDDVMTWEDAIEDAIMILKIKLLEDVVNALKFCKDIKEARIMFYDELDDAKEYFGENEDGDN